MRNIIKCLFVAIPILTTSCIGENDEFWDDIRKWEQEQSEKLARIDEEIDQRFKEGQEKDKKDRDEKEKKRIEDEIEMQFRIEDEIFSKRSNERYSKLKISSDDWFIPSSRRGDIGRINKNIKYIKRDLASLQTALPVSEVKSKIIKVFDEINKNIKEVKPMYINAKYSIDPRKYDSNTIEKNKVAMENHFKALKDQRDGFVELLIGMGIDSAEFDYSREDDEITPEYENQERIKQESEIYNKYQEIYLTKSQAEDQYIRAKESNDEGKILIAREEALEDAFINCVDLDRMLKDKYKEESNRNLYKNPKTDEELETLEIEAESLKYILCNRLRVKRSTSTRDLYDKVISGSKEYSREIMFKTIDILIKCAKYEYEKSKLLGQESSLDVQSKQGKLSELRIQRNNLSKKLNEEGVLSSEEDE